MLRVNFTILVEWGFIGAVDQRIKELNIQIDRVDEGYRKSSGHVYFDLSAERKAYNELLDYLENGFDGTATLVL